MRGCLRGAILSLLLIGAAVAAAPEADDLLDLLHVTGDEPERVPEGGIVSYPLRERAGNEVAMGLLITVPQPVDRVGEVLSRGRLFLPDPNAQRSGGMDALDERSVFADDPEEALRYLEAERGDQFNLSQPELRELHALRSRLAGADDDTRRRQAAHHYRELLSERWQAYRARGLSGIAPYARAEENADPAAELRPAARSHEFVNRYFPDLQLAWAKYPIPLRTGISETFLWLVRRIEDRPTPILLHWMAQTQPWGAVIAAREYYVGHSYNSSETLAGCLAYRGGTLIFYEIRSFTDQVTGLASELKHGIARQRLKDEMVERVEWLRESLR